MKERVKGKLKKKEKEVWKRSLAQAVCQCEKERGRKLEKPAPVIISLPLYTLIFNAIKWKLKIT